MNTPETSSTLDVYSKRIIEELQNDGRKPYAAIAESVGLSEAAVRQRVKRLIDSKLLQIVAVTDPLKVGFSRQAMVGVKVSGSAEAAAAEFEAFAEIVYILLTAGSFDILLEVVCEDDTHLLELLSRVRTLPMVESTETFMYLKMQKDRYDWGTR